VHAFTLTVDAMKANGSVTSALAKVMRNSQTVIFTEEHTALVKFRAKAITYGSMVMFTMASGKTVRSMAVEFGVL